MRITSKRVLLWPLVALCLMVMVGCPAGSDDGLDAKEVAMASRLDEIAQKSGGDWEKVSQADRDYLTKEISGGSEKNAKMMLLINSGKLKAKPGVPMGGKAPK